MSAHEVTRRLRETHFAGRVERARRQGAVAYGPWPGGEPAGPGTQDGPLLWNLLHLGRPAPHPPEPALSAALAGLELLNGAGGPGGWEVTAFQGVLAARDRAEPAGTGAVYIGEDSLRFTEAILQAGPTGRALDVGCGSGITTCALARGCREVTGVDLQPECLRATRLSAALNGCGERVRTWQGDFFTDFTPTAPLNCVAANLPYVPVPPALAYSAAGDGGPDGLDLNRRLLERAAGLLDPGDGMLVTRFQSLGDAAGPLLMPDIARFAKATGHDVSVVADGRVPPGVRAALTALHAHRHNPHLSRAAVLREVDAHMAGFGQPYYFACGLTSRSGGTGTVTFTDLSDGPLPDEPVTAAGRPPAGAEQTAVRRYRERSHDLPDGFWELGGAAEVAAPPERLTALLGALEEGASCRELAESVFADRFAADPLRARALYVTTELMAQCLVDAGLAGKRATAG